MRLKSFLASLLTASLLSLLVTLPALAIPPLPSSFYGRIKFNGGNVPDGTLIRALINGQSFAEGRTQTYQGDSVYSLDVRGDDSDTPALDGGHEGDTLQFEVGGALAAETGAWHSGTNVEVNLTVASTGGPAAPPPTLAPVPTQTPIAVAPRASTPTPNTAAAADNSGSIALIAGVVIVAAAGGAWWIARRRS